MNPPPSGHARLPPIGTERLSEQILNPNDFNNTIPSLTDDIENQVDAARTAFYRGEFDVSKTICDNLLEHRRADMTCFALASVHAMLCILIEDEETDRSLTHAEAAQLVFGCAYHSNPGNKVAKRFYQNSHALVRWAQSDAALPEQWEDYETRREKSENTNILPSGKYNLQFYILTAKYSLPRKDPTILSSAVERTLPNYSKSKSKSKH